MATTDTGASDLPALKLDRRCRGRKGRLHDELRRLPHARRRGHDRRVGPNLDDAKPSTELIVTNVTNGKGAMPPFGESLTAQQIADVAAYVTQSTGG